MNYPELLHGITMMVGVGFILLAYIVNRKMKTHLMCLVRSSQPYEVYIQKDVMHLYKVNLSSGIVFLSIGFSGLNLEGPPLLSFLIVGALIAVLVNENLT